MAKRIAALVCLLVLIWMALPVLSQAPKQNDAYPEFYFTRLMYTDTRGRGPAPGQSIPTDFDHGHGLGDRLARIYGAWLTDTWDADYQYMGGIQRLTNTKVYLRPHPLPIMSPELFSFPYAYTVEVGQMELTQQQADRMREYLMRGGFWHVDDFWGLRQWNQFERQIRKIFPNCEIVDLPLTHPIFHTFFNIDEILQPPNDGLGELYTRSGGKTRTWEQPDDTEPHVRGISDDHGRLMVLITYNSDFGDAWEWMDDPEYPTKFTGYAYKLGMNSIIYTMTH